MVIERGRSIENEADKEMKKKIHRKYKERETARQTEWGRIMERDKVL